MARSTPLGQFYVVDASVVLKWFVSDREGDSQPALHLRNAFAAGEIHLESPELLIQETANALRYKPGIAAETVLRAIDSLWEMDLVTPTDPQQSKLAIELAFQLDATVYDTTYLALAELHRSKLITADRKFYDQAGERGSILRLADVSSRL